MNPAVGDTVEVRLTGEVLTAYEQHQVDLLRVAVGPFEHSRAEVVEVRADDVTIVRRFADADEPTVTVSAAELDRLRTIEKRVRGGLSILDPNRTITQREQFLDAKTAPEVLDRRRAADTYAHGLLTRILRTDLTVESR